MRICTLDHYVETERKRKLKKNQTRAFISLSPSLSLIYECKLGKQSWLSLVDLLTVAQI
jgi:hypothetical protein